MKEAGYDRDCSLSLEDFTKVPLQILLTSFQITMLAVS
jgi:hypothetical protein